jgi:hypothetical protein
MLMNFEENRGRKAQWWISKKEGQPLSAAVTREFKPYKKCSVDYIQFIVQPGGDISTSCITSFQVHISLMSHRGIGAVQLRRG